MADSARLAAGDFGRTAKPGERFHASGPPGEPPRMDPTTAQHGRLQLVPPGTGDARGHDALTTRAAATVEAAAGWLADCDLRCAMSFELAAGGADFAVIGEAMGHGIDAELNDAAHDVRYSSYGHASIAMNDAGGRIEHARGAMYRALPLDQRSQLTWTPASAAGALLEARDDLAHAMAAIAQAATLLGVEGIESPGDPLDAWWSRCQNLSIELGQVARRVEGAVVSRRRQLDGQAAVAATLEAAGTELAHLAALAAELTAQVADG